MFTYFVTGYSAWVRRYTTMTVEADTAEQAKEKVSLWFDEITSVQKMTREG